VSDRDVTDVLDRLIPNVDDEVAEWDDVLRRNATLDGRRRRSWPPRSRYLLAGAVVLVVTGAVVALRLGKGGR